MTDVGRSCIPYALSGSTAGFLHHDRDHADQIRADPRRMREDRMRQYAEYDGDLRDRNPVEDAGRSLSA